MLADPVIPPDRDGEVEKLAIADWLTTWTQVPTGTNPIDLLASPLPHVGIERGLALSEVGLRREALGVLADARAEVWSDPWKLAQLALFLRDQGFHGLAARSGLRLTGLWPAGTVFDAPPEVQRLAHPLVYADLLSAEASVRNLDPMLLAAVIWQESLFEPSAKSSAGARGLGQVMPATGQDLAGRLGVVDFDLDDLYKPYISVEFAASYLAAMLDYFDDQLLVTLAAYNGGPGNTGRWLEAAEGDLDLFVDTFVANESRRYLQRVLERYSLYDALYRSRELEDR
jgi:soluble lytic murein transglycosylase